MSRKGLWTVSFGLDIALLVVLPLVALGALTWGERTRAAADAAPSLAVDMDPTNGSGPCNPIDSTRVSQPGEAYQVAVCLVDAPSAPGAFAFVLVYDDTMNQCIDGSAASEASPALDSNPDSNAGLTSFSTPSLGTGFNCVLAQGMEPACDLDPATGPGHGAAVLICQTNGTPTLSVGPGVAGPLAEVTFQATVAASAETFAIPAAVVIGADQNTYIEPPPCGAECGTGPGITNSIVFNDGAPPPTSTHTPPPTATNTPVPPTSTFTPRPSTTPHAGVGGKVLLPPAALADASTGPPGPSDGTVAIWATLAGAILLTLAAGASCATARRRR